MGGNPAPATDRTVKRRSRCGMLMHNASSLVHIPSSRLAATQDASHGMPIMHRQYCSGSPCPPAVGRVLPPPSSFRPSPSSVSILGRWCPSCSEPGGVAPGELASAGSAAGDDFCRPQPMCKNATAMRMAHAFMSGNFADHVPSSAFKRVVRSLSFSGPNKIPSFRSVKLTPKLSNLASWSLMA
jgi:hypothetical protein